MKRENLIFIYFACGFGFDCLDSDKDYDLFMSLELTGLFFILINLHEHYLYYGKELHSLCIVIGVIWILWS